MVSNYPDDAVNLAEKIEKAILNLEEQPYRGAERKYGFYAWNKVWSGELSTEETAW